MLKTSATVIGRALSWSALYWGFYSAVDYGLSDALPPLLRPAQYVPDSSYWNAGVTALLAMILGGAIVGSCRGITLERGWEPKGLCRHGGEAGRGGLF